MRWLILALIFVPSTAVAQSASLDLSISIAKARAKTPTPTVAVEKSVVKPANPIVITVKPVHREYPLGGRLFTLNGRRISWEHLAYAPEHRGKFDPTWLSQLYDNELQSLHGHDHDGIVQWQYVVRPAKSSTPAPVFMGVRNGVAQWQETETRSTVINSETFCPNGICPGPSVIRSRTRAFRRR